MRIQRKNFSEIFSVLLPSIISQRGKNPYNTVTFKTWITYPEKNKNKNIFLLRTHACPITAYGSWADLAAWAHTFGVIFLLEVIEGDLFASLAFVEIIDSCTSL